MSPQPLEAAFARFCETLDPAAMAEVFDRAAVELRPLARRLTRGRVEADDLIQETFLAAIEHRASFDHSRPLMPWLVGILVRQASSARRRARRELDPERLESRSTSTPVEELAAGEFQTVVMDALSRLSSRDRDVLIPLLFDGKRAVQIARELGHRPDTIRMRIHRGMARLRDLLPAGIALPGMFVDSRMLGVRRTVLEAAARAGGAPLAAPLAAGLSFSGLSVWIGVGLLALLALAWQVRARTGVGEQPAGTQLLAQQDEAPQRVTAQELPAPQQDQRRPAVLARELPAQDETPLLGRLMLSGRVAGLEAGEASAAQVEIQGLGPEPIDTRLSTTLDAAHGFECDVAPLARLGARRFLVRVEHPERLPVEARVERGQDASLSAGTLDLSPAWVLQGRVIDHQGEAREGVWVGVFSLQPGNKDVNSLDRTRSSADGSFRLRSPSGGPQAVIAFLEGLRPATRLFEALGRSNDLGTLSLEAGLVIAGTLSADAGVDVRGTQLRCEGPFQVGQRRLRMADRRFQLFGDRFELLTGIAACDASGSFAFRGLAPIAHEISVVKLPQVTAVAWDPIPIAASVGASGVQPPRYDLELRLPWSLIDFQLEDELATLPPLDELGIDICYADELPNGSPPPMNVRLRPGDGERLRLQTRPGAHYDVRLHGFTHRGLRELRLQALPSGACLSVPLEIAREPARSVLGLSFVGEGLSAGERVGVGFFPLAQDESALPPVERIALFERSGTLDEFMHLQLEQLPPGKWRAVARIGGSYSRSFGYLLPVEVEVELAPGARVDRSVSTRLGGRARVLVSSSTGARLSANTRLFDAAGREHPLQLVALAPDAAVEMAGRVVLSAYNELGPLPAGSWKLELSAPGHRTQAVSFEVAAERVVEFEARLEPL